MKNYGVILTERTPKDWAFGGISGIGNDEVLQPDGQWSSFLPDYEPQSTAGYDTMACVTYSGLNCLEALKWRKYGLKENWADRFTAQMSGTTSQGNYLNNVGDSIRKDGLVDEEHWPSLPWPPTFQDYYQAVPERVRDMGRTFLKGYQVSYEYVWDTQSELMEALKYGPIQAVIHAYGPYDPNTDIYGRTEERGNHAVMLYGYEAGSHWKIYDHYAKDKKKLAWDTRFHAAVKYDISKVTNEDMSKFKENTLYQMIEGRGGFLLMAAGKLRYDQEARIQSSWVVRNSKTLPDGSHYFSGGPTGVLTMQDIKDIQLWNLKNEPVEYPL